MVGSIGEFRILLLVSSEVGDPVLCSSSSGGGLPLTQSYFSISVGAFLRILNLFTLVLCSRMPQLLKWIATMRVSWFIRPCLLSQYIKHCGCATPLLSVLSSNLKTLVFLRPTWASSIVR